MKMAQRVNGDYSSEAWTNSWDMSWSWKESRQWSESWAWRWIWDKKFSSWSWVKHWSDI